MYCPDCGTQASINQKFCRSCGLDLHRIKQSIAGGNSSVELTNEKVEITGHLQSRRRRMLRWGFAVFWGGIVMAALLGIVGDAVQNFDPLAGSFIEDLAGIGGLIVLVGIGLMIYSTFLPKTLTAPTTSDPASKLQSQEPSSLPDRRGYVLKPSVTEHTTVKLEAPRREPPPTWPQGKTE